MIPVEVLVRYGAVVKHFDLGDAIYQEGGRPLFFYQIESGRVRISNFLEDGKEVMHKILVQNDSFGEVAIFEEANHIATATADSSCRILKLSTKSFHALLLEYPEYYKLLTQGVARDLRFKMFLTKLICTGCPETVLLNLIQYLNQDKKLVCPECKRLMLTRQQLANMTGLRVETVIRTLKQLDKSDKLHIIKGKVFIPADGLE